MDCLGSEIDEDVIKDLELPCNTVVVEEDKTDFEQILNSNFKPSNFEQDRIVRYKVRRLDIDMILCPSYLKAVLKVRDQKYSQNIQKNGIENLS